MNIYFPLTTKQKNKDKLVFNKGKYKYKLMHTSLDKLIKYLQLNQLVFNYYTIIPSTELNIAKNRFNLEGEISVVLPVTIKINKVFPLKYSNYTPSIRKFSDYSTIDTTYVVTRHGS